MSSLPWKCSIYYKTQPLGIPGIRNKGNNLEKRRGKAAGKESYRDYLSKPDIHKFIIHEGMNPQFLRELAIVFERKVNVIPIFRLGEEEDPGAIDWSALVPLKVFNEIN